MKWDIAHVVDDAMSSKDADPILFTQVLHCNSPTGILRPKGVGLLLGELCAGMLGSAKDAAKNAKGVLCVFLRGDPFQVFCAIVAPYAVFVVDKITKWLPVTKCLSHQAVKFFRRASAVPTQGHHDVAIFVGFPIQDSRLPAAMPKSTYPAKIADFIVKVWDWEPPLARDFYVFTHPRSMVRFHQSTRRTLCLNMK